MCRNNKVYSSSQKTDERGKILACSSKGGGRGYGISPTRLNGTDEARSVLRSAVAE